MIEMLRSTVEAPLLLNICGFIVGLAFGALAETTGFCTRAAIVETFKQQVPRIRLGQYLAAVLTALAITQFLSVAGYIDLTKSIFLSAPFNLGALVLGGMIFGIGMIMANGCPGRHLVLMSTGNTRSLLTLTVAGLAAYSTLRGILAYPRLGVEKFTPTNLLPRSAADVVGVPAAWLTIGICLLLVGILLFIARQVRFGQLAGGAGVGAIIGFAWWATGYLAASEFDPTRPTSLSFAAPIGEAIQYLLIFTGETMKFNVAMIGGLLFGALLSSLVGRRYKIQGFRSEFDVVRYGFGAVLMGFGAVTALGCSIGQSLSGISTLATSAFFVTPAIVVGAALMMALDRWYDRRIAARVHQVAAT